MDDVPSFFQLLEQHFDISLFIPQTFYNAFYLHLGHKREYPLTGFHFDTFLGDSAEIYGMLLKDFHERAINHFKINMCIAGRKTRNHTTTKADVSLAGIARQLTVIVAYSMNCLRYIRSLKPLIA